jgi:imidazolonepropionase-like amidohydrolase
MRFPGRRTVAGLALVLGVSPRPAPESGTILISMFERPLGREAYRIEPDAAGYRLVSDVDFTDRGTRVQLASSLRFAADFTPTHFEARGKSYRFVNVDAAFDAAGNAAVVRSFGGSSRVTLPDRFFTGRGYLPFALQALLVRYWERHGRPLRLPLFPGDSTNTVAVRYRGDDTVRIDGRAVPLRRYSVDGLVWGREALWLDDQQRFAAAVTRAHILPLEAVRENLGAALPALEAIATRDRIADLTGLADRVAPVAQRNFALTGARLIDGTGRAPLDDATVLVLDGRIAAAGPRARVAIPNGTHVLSARGKTIIPGLWDLHGHVSQIEWAPAYLAAGVTTVRDMGGVNQFLVALRDALASPRGLGPRLLLAGLIDGSGPNAMGTVIATTPEQGRKAVDDYRAAGFEQIKIYGSVAPGVVGAITHRAHELGMHVTGHVPNGMSLQQAVDSGMDEFAHLSAVRGEPGSPELRALIDLLAFHHTVADPTVAWNELLGRSSDTPIATFEPGILESPPPLAFSYNSIRNSVDRDRAQANLRRDLAVVKALHDAGVAIVAGTDGGVPGHSLLRTLELYVQAGLTPAQALATATTIPAHVMGLDHEAGTIEPGKRADLLVLDADPLANISNIRRTRWVVANGRLYDPAALWRSAGFAPHARLRSPVTK